MPTPGGSSTRYPCPSRSALQCRPGDLVGQGLTRYNVTMADAARVLEEALALSADERARIAQKLLHSLEAADTDAAATWSDEVRRRVDEIEAGTAELEDWDTVRTRLEAARRT